jgi:hypothetical protein
MMTVRKIEGRGRHTALHQSSKDFKPIGDCQNSQRAKSMAWLSLDHL